MFRSRIRACLLALLLATIAVAARAGREQLSLSHQSLELPGAPAVVLATELNHDGRTDLVLAMAFTELESIGVDRIEEMVQVSTVIPALFDRREIRAYVATDAGFAPAAPPLPMPRSVIALAAGAGTIPALALTDSGVSGLRMSRGGLALEWFPLIDDPPVLAGADTFFSDLEWVADVNGDGAVDLLLPAPDGIAVYLFDGEGYATRPVQRIELPAPPGVSDGLRLRYPLPRVIDVDGDGRDDLAFEGRRGLIDVWLGRGDGTFAPLDPEAACPAATTRLSMQDGGILEGRRIHFGDLDGDGRAETVTLEEYEHGDGWRKELKAAKKPRQRYRIYRLDDALAIEAAPYASFEAIGHSFEDVDFGSNTMELFQDLDGDGRQDLVTVTLRFSMFQVLKILATKRVTVGMDFHIWAQGDDGKFREVPDLDLSEKLKFDLNDLKLGRLAQFAGDFDGDGRIDFVHLGRGKSVTVHRGQVGCRYPVKPDLEIELEEEPQDLGLVRVADLDGDGRADIAITRSLPVARQDVSPPVQLELYLSGAQR